MGDGRTERRNKWIEHLIRNNRWITIITIIVGKAEGKPGSRRPTGNRIIKKNYVGCRKRVVRRIEESRVE